jgi:hypothetical protein
VYELVTFDTTVVIMQIHKITSKCRSIRVHIFSVKSVRSVRGSTDVAMPRILLLPVVLHGVPISVTVDMLVPPPTTFLIPPMFLIHIVSLPVHPFDHLEHCHSDATCFINESGLFQNNSKKSSEFKFFTELHQLTSVYEKC